MNHDGQLGPRTIGRVSSAALPLDGASEVEVLRRHRRGRKPLLDFRSEMVFSGVLFILMVWMAFVALTLWH